MYKSMSEYTLHVCRTQMTISEVSYQGDTKFQFTGLLRRADARLSELYYRTFVFNCQAVVENGILKIISFIL